MSYLLLVYLFLQPFLDVCAITPYHVVNMIIRGSFFVFMFVYLFIHSYNKKFLFFFVCSGFLIAGYHFFCDYGIYEIISSIMKLYYLPITILFFYYVSSEWIDRKYLLMVLIIYVTLFLTSYIFGFGYDSYLENEVKKGFKGVFNSMNEISAIMMGLLPLSLEYLREKKRVICSIMLLLSLFFVSILAGTKVLMLGLILIIMVFYFQGFVHFYKKLDFKIKWVFWFLILMISILGCYFLIHTNFFHNMWVQAQYFEVDSIFSFRFINKVLFNNRLTFLSENFQYFIKQDGFSYLFGIGFFHLFKLVEIDIFDILFRYGILGLVSFILPIAFVLKKGAFSKTFLFSVILLICISCTSGHVLLNPNVVIYFGYILLISKNYGCHEIK